MATTMTCALCLWSRPSFCPWDADNPPPACSACMQCTVLAKGRMAFFGPCSKLIPFFEQGLCRWVAAVGCSMQVGAGGWQCALRHRWVAVRVEAQVGGTAPQGSVVASVLLRGPLSVHARATLLTATLGPTWPCARFSIHEVSGAHKHLEAPCLCQSEACCWSKMLCRLPLPTAGINGAAGTHGAIDTAAFAAASAAAAVDDDTELEAEVRWWW